MAEQKIVVVSEVAPRLESLDGVAARKFLRDYVAYEMRLEATESQVPMKRCIEPEALTVLIIDNSEDWDVIVERPRAVGRAAGDVLDYHLDPSSGECGGVSDTVQSIGNGNKQVQHGSNLNNSNFFIFRVYGINYDRIIIRIIHNDHLSNILQLIAIKTKWRQRRITKKKLTDEKEMKRRR